MSVLEAEVLSLGDCQTRIQPEGIKDIQQMPTVSCSEKKIIKYALLTGLKCKKGQ